MIAAQLGATAATFVAGGVGNAMAAAALTTMVSSAVTQVTFTGSLNASSLLTTGLTSAITAGLLNGISYSNANGLDFSLNGSPNSLSALAGAKPSFIDGAVSQAGATSAGTSLT